MAKRTGKRPPAARHADTGTPPGAAVREVVVRPEERARALATLAREARERATEAERGAVAAGRDAGLSWDVLGGLLGIPGETVRRRWS